MRIVARCCTTKQSNNVDCVVLDCYAYARNDAQVDRQKKCAFTLAEVLITLAIIGVVAAIVVPAFFHKYQNYVYERQDEVFNHKIKQALTLMHNDDKLTGYNDTVSFVNELKKYLKIVRICPSSQLQNCFADKFIVEAENNKVFDISEVKKSDGLAKSYVTDNVGAVLADGTSIILSYNPDQSSCAPKSQFDISGITGCISAMYDLSGKKSPNKTNSDIRFLNAALNVGCAGSRIANICVAPKSTIVLSYSLPSIDTCDGKGIYEKKKCTSSSSSSCASNCSNNKYAAAVKYCQDMGMHLPTTGEIVSLQKYYKTHPVLKTYGDYRYLSSSETNDYLSTYAMLSGKYLTTTWKWYTGDMVMCFK